MPLIESRGQLPGSLLLYKEVDCGLRVSDDQPLLFGAGLKP
jgi:hypothetical protein